MKRLIQTLMTCVVLMVASAGIAYGCTGLSGCSSEAAGVVTGMTREQLAHLPQSPDDNEKSPVLNASSIRYEYGWTTACTGAAPGEAGADVLCLGAVVSCSNPANGPGPLTKIWRRIVPQDQPPGPWVLVGSTCWADAVPGIRPTMTLAMIQEAFNLTPWSKPQIDTQPAGNVTLVGLKTFYRVNWTTEGFQPNEIDAIEPARMNGYQVDIRVKLVTFMWSFGDGQTFGPTTSEGGVYPSGNITHAYLSGGSYPASVTTIFGGDFRINGGDWAPIPNTATVPGPATTVTVRTAEAQLVNH